MLQVFLILAFAVSGYTNIPAEVPVRVEVEGLRSDDGELIMHLFDSEKAFPSDKQKAIKKVRTIPEGGKAVFNFLLPPGEYAFVVFHDENKNNQVDKNFIGMPREGVASSNNAKGFMGPPDYSDAKFQVKAPANRMKVQMNYL